MPSSSLCVAISLAAALGVLGGPLPASAATVLEKALRLEVQGDGSIRESTSLRVHLDSAADLARWSPFAIELDEHRSLESLKARLRRPDGSVVELGRSAIDDQDVPEEGVLHSSRKRRLVRFPPAGAGAILELDDVVRESPYFPAWEVALGGADPIANLEVVVTGGGPGFAWSLAPPAATLRADAAPGGVHIHGALPGAAEIERAPDHTAEGPLLHCRWGNGATWRDVASWYEQVVRDLPRGGQDIERLARDLAGAQPDRRAQLMAVLRDVQSQIRYVAVEMGIGGYRPAPASTTWSRRWGDCKAKAFLLIDLLHALKIEAYPVLVLASEGDRVERDFPSPLYFNHLIVAVPAAGIATATDIVTDGLLFIDPTHPLASPAWFPAAIQGQQGLVVRGAESALVQLPLLLDRESRRLSVDLELDAGGGGRGQARLELSGTAAAAWIEFFKRERPEEAQRRATLMLTRQLPSANLARPSWTTQPGDQPHLIVTAELTLAGTALAGNLVALPGPQATPASSILADRSLPVVVSPGVEETDWRLKLPAAACPPPESSGIDNEVGSFRQEVHGELATVTVTRRTELRERFVEAGHFAALRELSLAEHRATKRLLRLDCAPPH